MRSEDSGDASKLCVSRRYNYQRGPSVYMLSADKGNDYGRNMYCTSLCTVPRHVPLYLARENKAPCAL